ncbi:MAG: hypothetical protein GC168_15270 [Candidatus Hydrogenedens sp.]|nr:hypothetical protein [Candidatus Hydrogenedens sp.]
MNRFVLPLLAALLAAALPARAQLFNRESTIRSMATTQYEVLSKKDGRVDIRYPNGVVVFENAFPAVTFEGDDETTRLKVDGKRSMREGTADALGRGKSMIFGKDNYAWAIRSYETQPFFTAQLKYLNDRRKPVRISELVVWKAEGGDGKGLLLGGPPQGVSVLSFPADPCAPAEVALGGGTSAWQMAARDASTGHMLVAGFLTPQPGGGRFVLRHPDDADRERGLDFEAVWQLDTPMELAPDESVESPVLYISVAENDFDKALRRYGKAADIWSKGTMAWTCAWEQPDSALTAVRRAFLAPYLLQPDTSGADTSAWPDLSRVAYGMLGGRLADARGVSFDPPLEAAASPAGPLTAETPRVWHLPLRSIAGDWHAIAVFNPDAAPSTTRVELASCGIEPYVYQVVFDVVAGQYLGTAAGHFDVETAPGAARLFVLRPWEDRPMVLGHGRHATLGAAAYQTINWDGAAGVLKVSLRGLQPGEQPLWLYCPDGWRGPTAAQGPVLATLDGKTTPAIPDGWTDIRDGSALAIRPDSYGTATIELRYERAAKE